MKRAAFVVLAIVLGLPCLIVVLYYAGVVSYYETPSREVCDVRFRAAWLGFLRQKAASNPEAAAALELLRRNPSIRLHLAPREEMQASFRNRPGWRRVLGIYDNRTQSIVIAQLPDREFFDRFWRPVHPQELHRHLESAAPVFIHEMSHLRTALELGFDPRGTLQSELFAFAREKRYLDRELPMTPKLRAIGRAKLVTTILGEKRTVEAADLALEHGDSAKLREARRIFRAWGIWSDAELANMSDEQVVNAMLVVASPRELCQAVEQPGWYGKDYFDLETSTGTKAAFAADAGRVTAARSYFREQLPEYAGCATLGSARR
jgi:hypothetical protein